MKKVLLATTALAIVAASASAVDVEMYGQVNKGLFAYDDGRNTNTVVVDNAKSSTRFGLKGAQALDNGLTASFLLESAIASNPSNAFTQTADTAGTSGQPAIGGTAAGASFTERQARVGLSGAWGGAYLGQQSTAIDSVRDQDLAGARDVMGASYASDFGSALEFRTSANAMSGNAVAEEAAPNSQNRAQSVRYDSPIWNGFQGRASVAQGGQLEGSVFYDGALAGLKVKGAAGMAFLNGSTGGTGTLATPNNAQTRSDASVSVAHSSGLAGTLAYNSIKLENGTAGADDPHSWYAKLGYGWDAYEVAADLGKSEGYAQLFGSGAVGAGTTVADDEMKSFGLGGQMNLGQGVSVAALYRNYSLERTGATYNDINMYGVNMRVKF